MVLFGPSTKKISAPTVEQSQRPSDGKQALAGKPRHTSQKAQSAHNSVSVLFTAVQQAAKENQQIAQNPTAAWRDLIEKHNQGQHKAQASEAGGSTQKSPKLMLIDGPVEQAILNCRENGNIDELHKILRDNHLKSITFVCNGEITTLHTSKGGSKPLRYITNRSNFFNEREKKADLTSDELHALMIRAFQDPSAQAVSARATPEQQAPDPAAPAVVAANTAAAAAQV